MTPTLSIVTTFAFRDGRLEPGVEAALRAHLSSAVIERVHVLTETDQARLGAHLSELGLGRVSLHPCSTRPTFADLLVVANERLHAGTEVVSLMNGDVHFAHASDAENAARACVELSSESGTVLALTRHEPGAGEPRLALETSLGLPNMSSADTWIFARPIANADTLDYSMGQMFCDKFFNHDLIAAGYRVYNPCLDCVTIHVGEERGLADYQVLARQEEAVAAERAHRRTSVREAQGHYFGLAPTSLAALGAGLRPPPMPLGKRRRRVYVAISVPQASTGGSASRWEAVADVCWRRLEGLVATLSSDAARERDVMLLVEHVDLQAALEARLASYAPGATVYAMTMRRPLRHMLRQILLGRDSPIRDVLCVPIPNELPKWACAEMQTLFVGLSLGERVQASKGTPPIRINPPAEDVDELVDAFFDGSRQQIAYGRDLAELAALVDRTSVYD